MKAISVVPGTSAVNLVDRSEPLITAPDEVKIRVLSVGICGTDREEASGGRALIPEGQTDLVIGHEMFGKVIAVGQGVIRVKIGDCAVLTVRRGCGKCHPCIINRPDMCKTGEYKERGIWGLDGYQTEYVVDKEQYAVAVPEKLESIGVLVEPLSIAEKAIDEAVRVQSVRLPEAATTPNWLFGRRCLVAGLGPVGLLASLALCLRGAKVYGLDIVDLSSARPQWLQEIGGQYVDGRKVLPDRVKETLGPMDLIFEATGIAALEFSLLDALAQTGVYVLTGIPGGDRPIQIAGAELIRQLVLDNQIMLGSVNASRDHFQMAVNDLFNSSLRWPDHISKLITHRYSFTDFGSVFTRHPSDEIKSIVEWSKT